MSIASEITRLQGAKSTLKTKLNAKNDEQHQITNETIDEYGDFVDSIQSSNIIGATAEGESLNLANTKAMPYSDYVIKGKSEQEGEPSPSIPSEIHSVADDVNLVDESLITEYENRGLRWKYDTESKKIKVTGTATSTYSQTDRYSIDLPAGTYIFTAYTESNLRFNVWLYNSSGTLIGNTSTNNPVTINEEVTKITLFCEGTASGITYNEELNVKIQKGTVATPYSPYNQGTVTIKQRGKNLWTSNLPIIFSDGSSIVQDNNNGGIDMTLAKTASLGYIFYDLGLISDFAGKTLTFSIGNEPNALYRYCALMACNADGSNRQELKNFYKNNQITYTVGNNYSQTHLAVRLYIAEGTGGQTYSINNVQVEEKSEKTDYEPYQANDFTFQTEPLRSLPNGVKDTIEADGIHRRVGRIVLGGTEGWIQAGTQYSGLFSAYISISNLKLQDNFDNDLICNRFIEKTFDNQSECITKSSAPLQYNFIIIRISNTKATSIETFKTWLSTHNTEVLYPLAEEIIEPLTQNQATTMLDIIKTGSYEGTTNIYTDEDVKPTMKVGYYKKG